MNWRLLNQGEVIPPESQQLSIVAGQIVWKLMPEEHTTIFDGSSIIRTPGTAEWLEKMLTIQPNLDTVTPSLGGLTTQ